MLNSEIIKKDCFDLVEFIGKIKDKTFLITGSNGLIGNYFVNFLDYANTYFNTNAKAICISKNPPQWKSKYFTYLALDLTKEFSLSVPIIPDYIIHGACYSTPKKFLSDQLNTIELNVDVTKKLLRASKIYGATLLFLSSGSIYGDVPQSELPIEEDHFGYTTPYSIRAAYTESKRLGETLCNIYGQKVVRLGYIYGPGNCEGKLLSDLIWQAIRDKKIMLMTNGSEIRSYCYITDAIRMMFHVLFDGKNSPYNVDGQENYSIKEIANIVAKYFGIECKVGYNIPQLGAPNAVNLDNSKICSEFKLPKFISLEDGLKRNY
jgi:UDP-glucuronate decarboxylase